MSSGLYSGTSGLALGTGLSKGVQGLYSGAPGLVTGSGEPIGIPTLDFSVAANSQYIPLLFDDGF